MQVMILKSILLSMLLTTVMPFLAMAGERDVCSTFLNGMAVGSGSATEREGRLNPRFDIPMISQAAMAGNAYAIEVTYILKALFPDLNIYHTEDPDYFSGWSRELHAQTILDGLVVGVLTDRRAQLRNRNQIPTLFLASHQHVSLQRQTAKLLTNDYFKDVPRLFLVSAQFPITDEGFARSASLLFICNGGSLRYNGVSATDVFIVGGYADACVSNATGNLIENARRLRQSEIHLHYVSDLVYGSLGVPIGDNSQILLSSYRAFPIVPAEVATSDGRRQFAVHIPGDRDKAPLLVTIDFPKSTDLISSKTRIKR